MIRKSYRTHPWVSFDDAKNLEHHVYTVMYEEERESRVLDLHQTSQSVLLTKRILMLRRLT